jgi:hypothetical protein
LVLARLETALNEAGDLYRVFDDQDTHLFRVRRFTAAYRREYRVLGAPMRHRRSSG